MNSVDTSAKTVAARPGESTAAKKKPLNDKQLETLARARQKAAEVRKVRAAEKQKQIGLQKELQDIERRKLEKAVADARDAPVEEPKVLTQEPSPPPPLPEDDPPPPPPSPTKAKSKSVAKKRAAPKKNPAPKKVRFTEEDGDAGGARGRLDPPKRPKFRAPRPTAADLAAWHHHTNPPADPNQVRRDAAREHKAKYIAKALYGL
ncbi:g8139 [Coccomyxa viridis]|uniref:G8139 protein n=1 Tax=Coccomyxa viridis TaxID=1274662 RepID=A0ABP1G241_9CHLO